jgi:predicted N-formylglutamate amidohydrolase
MTRRSQLILSCEHGGYEIPAHWKKIVQIPRSVLTSHRGWDRGALPVVKQLSHQLQVPVYAHKISRLLIETNRSPHHAALFSRYSRHLLPAQKLQMIEDVYRPYRDQVTHAIQDFVERDHLVIHLSIHSFTPRLGQHIRNNHIGLLYDSGRKRDRGFCYDLKHQINKLCPHWRIRMNYPYRGTSDGFVPALRKHFPQGCYLGIEIEINQKIVSHGEARGIATPIGKALCEMNYFALCQTT